ncbi:MAG TPA: hypothetical protein VLG37_01255 [Candidatus Saccharimonadales bacterium]|nr:hypothetical protein [Candidatus Saccharimonadales bacterium]
MVAERRNGQQVILAQVSGAVVLDGSVDVDYSIPPRTSPYEAYEKLGDEMFEEFLAQLSPDHRKQFRNNGTNHGFRVIARILQYAPAAYKDFCVSSKTDPTLQELLQILLDSSETPNFFARMDGTDNAIYETVFGILDQDWSPYNGHQPFVIDLSDGTAKYIPNSVLRDRVLTHYGSSLRGSSVAEPPKPYEFCPARGRFMDAIWAAGAQRCVSTPTLFPAALGPESLIV